eukprot:g59614.t1
MVQKRFHSDIILDFISVIDMTVQSSSEVNDVAGRQSETEMETEMSEPEEVETVEHESEDEEWQPPVDDWDPQPTSCGKSEREKPAASIRARIDEEYEQAEVDDLAARARKGELNPGEDSHLAWAIAASIEEANKAKMLEVRNDQKLEHGLWLREQTRAKEGGQGPRLRLPQTGGQKCWSRCLSKRLKTSSAGDKLVQESVSERLKTSPASDKLESVSERLKTSTVTSATQEPATRATVTEALAAVTEALAAVTELLAASESEVMSETAFSNSEN